MMIQPIPLPIETEYTFTDEEFITAAEKWQILHDWQHFLGSGFKKLFFSRALYHFLTHPCGLPSHATPDRFWHFFCNAEPHNLAALLNQFGGDQRHAELGNRTWLAAPAPDLKAAMSREAERLYVPLNQVLQDLAYKHEELVAAWHDFAQAAQLQEVPLPPHYLVSENTRNLLAYAAQIALTQPRPLAGLQLRFPLDTPFLQEVTIDG
jgi:hypothetical protein